jgi:hypothetical protein
LWHFTLHVALHLATSLHTVPALASCLPDIFLMDHDSPFRTRPIHASHHVSSLGRRESAPYKNKLGRTSRFWLERSSVSQNSLGTAVGTWYPQYWQSKCARRQVTTQRGSRRGQVH